MSLRDILAVVTSQNAAEHVIAFAEQLALQTDGRVSASLVNWQPNVAPVDGWMIDPGYGDLVAEAHRHLKEETEKLRVRIARCERAGALESSMLDFDAAPSVIGQRARHADVTIVSQPTADKPSANVILEGALFESGRPVIIVPTGWKPAAIGRNILVAWKPTREAARALADADALILAAEQTSVVTVDAKPSRGYSEQPGADIAAHLAFRGAKPTVFNLDSAGATETAAILRQGLAVGADLIVMGGYGRSRLSELIFGGVTREILRTSSIPVLMSH